MMSEVFTSAHHDIFEESCKMSRIKYNHLGGDDEVDACWDHLRDPFIDFDHEGKCIGLQRSVRS